MTVMDQVKKDFIYLVACAVNQTAPEHTEAMDLDQLFELAERHQLSATLAFALEAAGRGDERTTTAIMQSVRRTAIMDVELRQLEEKMERAGIWYMPLKGAVLKDYYPKYGMRQMVDFDVLYDADRAAELREIMEEQGFKLHDYTNEHKISIHDVYFKEPVTNFEMHRALFKAYQETKGFAAYYADVKDRLLKDEGNGFGYHFSHEDFYVYMLAHEYKHYVRGGTGLRTLVDVYVFLKRFENKLDWADIENKLALLELTDFEKANRLLALALFGGKELTDDEEQMLAYMTDSGAYGNLKTLLNNRAERAGGKGRYLLGRLVLPMETIKIVYPFFEKHRLLLPALPFYRLWLAIRKKRVIRITKELQTLKRRKKGDRHTQQ